MTTYRTYSAEEMHKKGLERLSYWAKRLQRLVELNAPDCVLADATMILFLSACGHMTDDMEREFLKLMRKHSRAFVGTCMTCDAERGPGLELCPACEAKEEAEVARWEAEEQAAKGGDR